MKPLFIASLAALPMLAQAPFVDLSGEWRHISGDQPAYASPDFDDRNWDVVHLPWRKQPPDGLAWLRRSVELPGHLDRARLALALGPVSPVHEVYVNGALIGQTGPFFDDRSVYVARDRVYAIPAAAVGDGSRMVIAIRARSYDFPSQPLNIFRGGSYLLTSTDAAGLVGNPGVLHQQRVTYSPHLMASALLFVLALLLGLVWLSTRERTELPWLALILTIRGMFDWRQAVLLSPGGGPHSPFSLARFGEVALIELCFAAVAMPIGMWRPLIWIVALGSQFIVWDARPMMKAFDIAAMLALFTGWWRNGGIRQPWIPHLTAGALALLALTRFNSGGTGLFPVFFPAAGYLWSVQSWTTILLGTILTVLMVISLGADRREKQRLAGELAAARGVQQLLISGQQPPDSSYTVESVYEPAQEVGGDFYQALGVPDGSLLVVVGDVSGKGLKAALTVSMMTGVIRAHSALPPADLLRAMNQVLGEGSGGFVTAIAIRCEPDGNLTVANAGHLAPYAGGTETVTEPGLPLGVSLAAEYTASPLRLAPGETMTLLTDGVVEAANEKSELFGFDRTREISGKSTREIADAARAWGQNDDITVVTVRRRET